VPKKLFRKLTLVIAPMLISMGYFPTNVYRALGMNETLEVIEDVVKEGRLYND